MPKDKRPTLLVTGASGQLGAKAVETLLERGGAHVIAATRNPEKIARLAAAGAEVRHLDFEDPSSLRNAFKHVDRALIVSTDDLETPERRLRQHRAAIDAAEKAKVAHVVYTSAPAPAPGKAIMGDHFWTEQALAASKLGWTILRNHQYADLLLMSLPHAVQTGSYVSALGKGARNFVTRDDAARAAAGALISDFNGRRILNITGPAPINGDELAAIVTDIAAKPIAYAPVSADQLREGLAAAGLPRGLVDGLVQFDLDSEEGHQAVTTRAVLDLTSREPQSVRDFLRQHAATLIGSVAA